MKHFLLYYDFGPDYFERRGELTPLHMAYLAKAAEAGDLVLGGACVEGRAVQGVYLLEAESREQVEAFARADPYFQIAAAWRITEWITVAGKDALTKL